MLLARSFEVAEEEDWANKTKHSSSEVHSYHRVVLRNATPFSSLFSCSSSMDVKATLGLGCSLVGEHIHEYEFQENDEVI